MSIISDIHAIRQRQEDILVELKKVSKATADAATDTHWLVDALKEMMKPEVTGIDVVPGQPAPNA